MSDFLPSAISGFVVAASQGTVFRVEPRKTATDADEFHFVGQSANVLLAEPALHALPARFVHHAIQASKTPPLPDFEDEFEFIEGAYLADFVA